MGDENLESLRRLNAKLFALETLNKEQEYEQKAQIKQLRDSLRKLVTTIEQGKIAPEASGGIASALATENITSNAILANIKGRVSPF